MQWKIGANVKQKTKKTIKDVLGLPSFYFIPQTHIHKNAQT